MFKISQHEIELIGEKLFGKIKGNDFTVFEFKKLFRTNKTIVLIGQIYHYNNCEEYADIEITKSDDDYISFIYVHMGLSDYTLGYNTFLNEIEEYD